MCEVLRLKPFPVEGERNERAVVSQLTFGLQDRRRERGGGGAPEWERGLWVTCLENSRLWYLRARIRFRHNMNKHEELKANKQSASLLVAPPPPSQAPQGRGQRN